VPFYIIPVPNRYGFLNTAWGVGGTTLMYFGNHPRAHYYALEEWNDLPGSPSEGWVNELAPYFDFLESPQGLPVPNAPMGYGPFDTHNAMTLVGAANFNGLAAGDPHEDLSEYLPYMNEKPYIPMYNPDQYDPEFGSEPGGYRGQPNNMTTNCWHCGNCLTGCHKPENAQLKDKVKRATNVSFIPDALDEGLDLRPQSMVVAVFHADTDYSKEPPEEPPEDLPRVIVLYGQYEYGPDGLPKRYKLVDGEWKLTIGTDPDGIPLISTSWMQPADYVVFAAGTIETPRLYLQSNAMLNDPTEIVDGKTFREQVFSEVDDHYGYDACRFYIRQDPYQQQYYTLSPNPFIGRNFMTHNENWLVAIYNKPVEMWVGQNSQSRVDVPGVGMIESIAAAPMVYSTAAFAKDIRVDLPQFPGAPLFEKQGLLALDEEGNPIPDSYGNPVVIPDPYYNPSSGPTQPYLLPGPKFGVDTKNFHTKYSCSKVLGAFAEDDPLPTNRVFLEPDLAEWEPFYVAALPGILNVPRVNIQYHPSDGAKERAEILTKICVEMFKKVGDSTPDDGLKLEYVDGKPQIFNQNIEINTIYHSMGTMSMGQVVDSNCQVFFYPDPGDLGIHLPVSGVYVADACVLPNSIGGPNPVHTIQAMALRTAEAIFKDSSYYNETSWRKWKEKIGMDPYEPS
jgi:hypothetical protein